MLILKTIREVKDLTKSLRTRGSCIGLVPTMGALHKGHLDIVRRSVIENESVIVSIFVNPTQFNDPSDLEKYPRNLELDASLLSQISKDIVLFVPEIDEMYPDSAVSDQYEFNGLDELMEGKFRPGHFQGVATVVEKLLRIVEPDKAYFGEKDYQQLQIIKSMVRQKRLKVSIVPCSIVREVSGLAMSSRNARLSKRLRKEASFIYKTLKSAKVQFGMKSAQRVTDWVYDQFRGHADLKIEYFLIADDQNLRPVIRKSKVKKYRAFIAVYAEDIRLIDNIALN